MAVGSAVAQVSIEPFGEDDSLICTRAYVASGVERTYELYEFLLQENHRAMIGGFGLDPRGNVFYQHSILGNTCDEPELRSSVLAVVLLADKYDDEVVQRWGGKRAVDRVLSR